MANELGASAKADRAGGLKPRAVLRRLGLSALIPCAALLSSCDKPRAQQTVWTIYYVKGPECDPPHQCDDHGFLIAGVEAKRKVAKSCPNANPLYVERYGHCPRI